MYRVYLNDGMILDLYEEVILKHELLLCKKVDREELNDIESSNKFYDCYYSALKYIKSSLKTRKEVFDKLKFLEYQQNDINKALDKLEEQGYINDYNYASSYLNLKLITTNYGPNRIAGELEKKGVASNIISEVLLKYDDDIQREKIKKIIDKQIKANHSKGSLYLKRKIKLDLRNQGFNNFVIDELLSSIVFEDDSSIRDKEYQKLYQKLSKKYSGKELEYKIREKMMQKGFRF